MDNLDIAFENNINSGSRTIYLDDFSANLTSGVASLSVQFTELSQNAMDGNGTLETEIFQMRRVQYILTFPQETTLPT
jgi:PKD repeat protein